MLYANKQLSETVNGNIVTTVTERIPLPFLEDEIFRFVELLGDDVEFLFEEFGLTFDYEGELIGIDVAKFISKLEQQEIRSKLALAEKLIKELKPFETYFILNDAEGM